MLARIRSFGWGLLATALVCGRAPLALEACDTPVYRYAMYRWNPAPYEVYCFHRGSLGDRELAVQQAIIQAANVDRDRANVVFLPVNLDADEKLLSIPPDVREAWKSSASASDEPGYLVSTPRGLMVYRGSLDEATVRELLDSPARRSLAGQLESGKAGVFVVLLGTDPEANLQAEQLVRKVVQSVREGGLDLYVSPNDVAARAENPEAAPKYDVGVITVARDDPAESWLVRTLLSVEPGLGDEPGPIVYMSFGRGRAIFSCSGKGINESFLVKDVQYITGACSCTVKEQNPGQDLLVKFDWDEAAAVLAERYGSEEGNEARFSTDLLFPELVIPAKGEVAAPPEAQGGSEEDEASAAAPPNDAVSAPGPDDTRRADATEIAAVAPPRDGPPPGNASPPSAFRSVFAVGAGLAIALVLMFGATFLVLRPR